MKIAVGPHSQAEERYLDALSYAPRCHLLSLLKRNAAILMAPSIAIGLDSIPAAERRGRALTSAERAENSRTYAVDSGVVAIYDPETDAVVLPTARTTSDPEHPVLHELGHALTYREVDALDADLVMRDLPAEITRHISLPGYKGDRRAELAEVLAEAYAWTVVGRLDELGLSVVSALIGILPADVEFFADPF